MKKIPYLISFGILSLAMIFLTACNAVLPAGAKASISSDGKSAQVEFTGVVGSMAADQWVVSGQKLLIDPQSSIDGAIVVGDTVKVYATVASDGAVTADKIEAVSGSSPVIATIDPSATVDPLATATPGFSDDNEKEFSGVVETISPDSWQVGGQVFIVNPHTEIKGNILVGDNVKVHFLNNGDGTFTATEIELMDNQEQEQEQKHPEDLKLTGKVEAFAPDSWTVKGQVFTINSETEIKDNILLGDVVKVQYVVNADGTFTATEIELAGDNQAHNSEKKLTGVLQELTLTQATIGGVVVLITPQTQLDNGLVLDVMVKAEVVANSDGTITALKIEQSGHDDKSGKGDSNKGSGKSGSGHGSDDNQTTPVPGGDDHGGD